MLRFVSQPAQALYGLASFSRQLTLQMIRELEIATPVQWGQLQVFTDSTNWRLARAQHKFGLAAAENHDGVEIADSPRPFGAGAILCLVRGGRAGGRVGERVGRRATPECGVNFEKKIFVSTSLLFACFGRIACVGC